MKEKEGKPKGDYNSKKDQKVDKELITSDSVKNANASGDGSLGRSKGSIPDEEDLSEDSDQLRKGREQY